MKAAANLHMSRVNSDCLLVQATANILQLLQEDQGWAQLRGVPTLLHGYHGLAHTLHGPLSEFKVGWLECGHMHAHMYASIACACTKPAC